MAKKGVSLIILVMTIIVLGVITTSILVSTTSIADTASAAKFGEDLKKLEDAIKEYYVVNGSLPVYTYNKYTAAELVALNTLGYGEALQDEIAKNKDTLSTFYEINYSLINTVITDMGLGSTQDDIYVVSSENNKVYYVKGIPSGDDIYFSTVNISGITQIN